MKHVDDIKAEIEIIRESYEQVSSVEKNLGEFKVMVCLNSELRPNRKLIVEITTIPGYPYISPKVSVKFASNVKLGDSGALTLEELEEIKKIVCENIEPCVSSGIPCMMQILSSITEFINKENRWENVPSNNSNIEVHKPYKFISQSNNESNIHIEHDYENFPTKSNEKIEKENISYEEVEKLEYYEANALEKVNETALPEGTPVPLRAKDALKLSLLTLHFLRKCCYLKQMESKVEAETIFESAAKKIIESSAIFPSTTKKYLPWNENVFTKLFKQERESLTNKSGNKHVQESNTLYSFQSGAEKELMEWLWTENEILSIDYQHSEGRYKREFIEQYLLGSGGFAPVYVCRKKIDGKLYAIKKVVMRSDSSDELLHEVQALASLEHENVVRYYDAWTENGIDEELEKFLPDCNSNFSNNNDNNINVEDNDSIATTTTTNYVNKNKHNENRIKLEEEIDNKDNISISVTKSSFKSTNERNDNNSSSSTSCKMEDTLHLQILEDNQEIKKQEECDNAQTSTFNKQSGRAKDYYSDLSDTSPSSETTSEDNFDCVCTSSSSSSFSAHPHNVKRTDYNSQRQETIATEQSSLAEAYNHTSSSTNLQQEQELEEEELEEEWSESSSSYETSSELNEHQEEYMSSSASTESKFEHENKKAETCKYTTLFIQMELCSAQSLRDLLDNVTSNCESKEDRSSHKNVFEDSNGEKLAISILRQLLEVISYTHRQQIIHRDLKPENILFEANKAESNDMGIIRVVDFGLARVMNTVRPSKSVHDLFNECKESSECENENVTNRASLVAGQATTSEKCGTVLYCAPEMEEGMYYDYKVDEFSIGMIAYEMWLAVAGKGFRERFLAMNDVWRSGTLPSWFSTWRPEIATIITKLLQHNNKCRTTCAEILSMESLPGAPIEITESLNILDKYGTAIHGQIIQHLRGIAGKSNKVFSSSSNVQMHNELDCIYTKIINKIHSVVLLHQCIPISNLETIIPSKVDFRLRGVEYLVNTNGEWYIRCIFPQYALSWMFVQLINYNNTQFSTRLDCRKVYGSKNYMNFYYSFHYANKPLLSLTVLKANYWTWSMMYLRPFLSIMHLLSLVKLEHEVELVISHARWMHRFREYKLKASSAFHSEHTHTQKKSYEEEHLSNINVETASLSFEVDDATIIAERLKKIEEILCSSKMTVAENEHHENCANILTKFVIAILHVRGRFGKDFAQHFRVKIDAALEPSSEFAEASMMTTDIIAELYIVNSIKENKKSVLATAFSLNDYISLYSEENSNLSAFTLLLDIKELVSLVDKCKWELNNTNGLLLCDGGIAICQSNEDNFQQTLMSIDNAIALWSDNISSFLCSKSDILKDKFYDYGTVASATKANNNNSEANIWKRLLHELQETKYAKYVLKDNKLLIPIACESYNNEVIKPINITSTNVCEIVRSLQIHSNHYKFKEFGQKKSEVNITVDESNSQTDKKDKANAINNLKIYAQILSLEIPLLIIHEPTVKILKKYVEWLDNESNSECTNTAVKLYNHNSRKEKTLNLDLEFEDKKKQKKKNKCVEMSTFMARWLHNEMCNYETVAVFSVNDQQIMYLFNHKRIARYAQSQ